MTAPTTKPDTAPAETNEPVLLRDAADGIATLTLNRPRAYNALSEELIDALQDALDEIARDKDVRVVILGAAGKAFCAGHDLKEMRATPDASYYRALFAKCSRLMTSIVALPQPVIARVHGIATAAGCQLVATCDLAVAADDARFATNGISNGLFCSTPSVALSRNVAPKQAFEMLFTGEFVDAETARSIGLVNRVVPEAELAQGALGAGPLDRREVAGHPAQRQGDVLQAARHGPRRRLRLRRREHGLRHDERRRRRGHRRLHREAQAGVEGRVVKKAEWRRFAP